LIVVDTSSLQRYLAGLLGRDTKAVADAVARHEACLPPVVVTEALSNFFLDDEGVERILALPMIELMDGYWVRAGRMRAKLLRNQQKAKLGDVLITQICLDYRAPLITDNGDFNNFVDLGLKLV
jgi:predicted nucleic acid-binding protein